MINFARSKYNVVMLIAQKLRKKNIAEYLIYMWQVEDLLRANDLDIDKIRKNISSQFDQPEEVQQQITEWYESLIEMMRAENVQQQGHLALNNNVIIQLTDLHLALLKSGKHADYSALYYKALPYIVELRAKSDNINLPEIETCFSALYGFMLIKMKGDTVSEETQQAIKQISSLLAVLALKFAQDENEELEL